MRDTFCASRVNLDDEVKFIFVVVHCMPGTICRIADATFVAADRTARESSLIGGRELARATVYVNATKNRDTYTHVAAALNKSGALVTGVPLLLHAAAPMGNEVSACLGSLSPATISPLT